MEIYKIIKLSMKIREIEIMLNTSDLCLKAVCYNIDFFLIILINCEDGYK